MKVKYTKCVYGKYYSNPNIKGNLSKQESLCVSTTW